jgi:hypothetical protein
MARSEALVCRRAVGPIEVMSLRRLFLAGVAKLGLDRAPWAYWFGGLSWSAAGRGGENAVRTTTTRT